jgi:hypothetical protein
MVVDSAGRAITYTSATPPAPANFQAPTIAGVALTGDELTLASGSWTNSPDGFIYQWEDCDTTGAACTPIANATGIQYTVTAADVGHTIAARVTGTNSGGSGSAAAAATTAITLTPASPVWKAPCGSAAAIRQRLARVLKSVARGAQQVDFATPCAGAITVRWYLGQVVLGHGSATAARAGLLSVKVALTRAGRLARERRARVHVRSVAVFIPRSGHAVTRSVTTVRRP